MPSETPCAGFRLAKHVFLATCVLSALTLFCVVPARGEQQPAADAPATKRPNDDAPRPLPPVGETPDTTAPRPLPPVGGTAGKTAPGTTAPGAKAAGEAASPNPPDFRGEAAAAAGDANRVPDLGRELADTDVGGFREALSNVPTMVGDGCAPGGSGGKATIDRLVLFGTGLTSSNTGKLLTGPTPGLILETPQTYRDIQSLPGAGVIPGAVGVGIVPGSPSFQTTGIPPGGAGSIVGPTAGYATSVDAAMKNEFITRTGNSQGETVFTPETSGALPTGVSNTYDAYAYYNYVVDTASATPGFNVGFVKISENLSPLPRDRVFFNYSYFKNSYFAQDLRADVNRFMPGFEKTFFDGWTSIEVRTPFASTLSSVQGYDASPGAGITNNRDVEFGNMSVIGKSVITHSDTWALTAGMQVMCPTASNVSVQSTGVGPTISAGKDLLLVENQSVHTMPFMGFLWAPNDRFFTQSLLQLDVDTNGNPAYANVLLTNNIKQSGNYAGRLTYPTFMYVGLSAGYWFYKNDSPYATLTGIAPIMELHINQSLTSYDVLCQPGYQIGEDLGSLSMINGMVGFNMECGTRSTMTFAYVSPIGGGVDRWFDGEVRAMYNWRFGPQTRLTRVQF
jgi:hypothetical protein